MKLNSPIVLLILDGWGVAPNWGANAIAQAQTPNFDRLWKENPHCQLEASGKYVGLPGNERGNSEVGHLSIGSGRVVYQNSSKITQSIKDNSFFSNEKLIDAFEYAKKNHSNVHIMGILSTGKVHGDIQHLYALLDLAKKQNFSRVYLDLFTDGRDTSTMAAIELISHLNQKIKEIGVGQITSIIGRYYAMDRNNRWERIKQAYDLMVEGKGQVVSSALSGISDAYKRGKTDQYLDPISIHKQDEEPITIKDNDSIIFLNFRSDRARQITQAFMNPKFNNFKRKTLHNIYFVTMIPYGVELEIGKNIHSAFQQKKLNHTLADVLSENNILQFHIAETEKYAHVTYFFNGGQELAFPNEERLMIASPKIDTYDEKPEMSVNNITKELINRIRQKKIQFYVVNFANTDMVGHTGIFRAAVEAVEAVDNVIGQIYKSVAQAKGILIITADHGNSDEMIYPDTGNVSTQHSKNPVPFILVDTSKGEKFQLRSNGVLADIAPTILKIFDIEKPKEMTGQTLIKNNDSSITRLDSDVDPRRANIDN